MDANLFLIEKVGSVFAFGVNFFSFYL